MLLTAKIPYTLLKLLILALTGKSRNIISNGSFCLKLSTLQVYTTKAWICCKVFCYVLYFDLNFTVSIKRRQPKAQVGFSIIQHP